MATFARLSSSLGVNGTTLAVVQIVKELEAKLNHGGDATEEFNSSAALAHSK
ncbi:MULTISPECIES: hypothetical protein [Bacillus]|uniref:hypothetical protein n=1 Tax=Bacillus TaxID=1386 RepID=UPI00148370BD|nr:MULTISPECIES: hypothetical protein [Bacillus]